MIDEQQFVLAMIPVGVETSIEGGPAKIINQKQKVKAKAAKSSAPTTNRKSSAYNFNIHHDNPSNSVGNACKAVEVAMASGDAELLSLSKQYYKNALNAALVCSPTIKRKSTPSIPSSRKKPKPNDNDNDDDECNQDESEEEEEFVEGESDEDDDC